MSPAAKQSAAVRSIPKGAARKATAKRSAAKRTQKPDTANWRAKERAAFVVDVVGGTRRAAELLDVAPSQPSRWVSGASVPGPAQARQLVDLEHVLTHALLVWADNEGARDWLTTPNAHLDSVRPVDWLKTNGTAEIIDALRAEAAGAYA